MRTENIDLHNLDKTRLTQLEQTGFKRERITLDAGETVLAADYSPDCARRERAWVGPGAFHRLTWPNGKVEDFHYHEFSGGARLVQTSELAEERLAAAELNAKRAAGFQALTEASESLSGAMEAFMKLSPSYAGDDKRKGWLEACESLVLDVNRALDHAASHKPPETSQRTYSCTVHGRNETRCCKTAW
jgi:hypothetical protein